MNAWPVSSFSAALFAPRPVMRSTCTTRCLMDQRNDLQTSIRVRDRIDPAVIADTIGEQFNMPPFGLVQGGDRWQ